MVKRCNTLNELESKLTGIDYSKPLEIDSEKIVDDGYIQYQIIYFTISPNEPHVAQQYKPYGKTKEEYDKYVLSNPTTKVKKINTETKAEPFKIQIIKQ